MVWCCNGNLRHVVRTWLHERVLLGWQAGRTEVLAQGFRQSSNRGRGYLCRGGRGSGWQWVVVCCTCVRVLSLAMNYDPPVQVGHIQALLQKIQAKLQWDCKYGASAG